jgi:signal transduction histidine kinase
VRIDVIDDGAGAASESIGSGLGIRGMRERAAAVGGQLEAGPLPGRGFRMHATLPTAGP